MQAIYPTLFMKGREKMNRPKSNRHLPNYKFELNHEELLCSITQARTRTWTTLPSEIAFMKLMSTYKTTYFFALSSVVVAFICLLHRFKLFI